MQPDILIIGSGMGGATLAAGHIGRATIARTQAKRHNHAISVSGHRPDPCCGLWIVGGGLQAGVRSVSGEAFGAGIQP